MRPNGGLLQLLPKRVRFTKLAALDEQTGQTKSMRLRRPGLLHATHIITRCLQISLFFADARQQRQYKFFLWLCIDNGFQMRPCRHQISRGLKCRRECQDRPAAFAEISCAFLKSLNQTIKLVYLQMQCRERRHDSRLRLDVRCDIERTPIDFDGLTRISMIFQFMSKLQQRTTI